MNIINEKTSLAVWEENEDGSRTFLFLANWTQGSQGSHAEMNDWIQHGKVQQAYDP